MALCSFVERRRDRYYFRARLPVDIAGAVKRTHVVASLATADPRAARKHAAQFLLLLIPTAAEIDPSVVGAAVGIPLILRAAREPSARYRSVLRTAGISLKTVWSYDQAFNIWAVLIGDKPIAAIRRADVKLFADSLRDRKNPRGGILNHKTILRSLGHIKSFMNWAVAAGWTVDDAFGQVSMRGMTKAERFDGPPRRAFTDAELNWLFQSPLFLKPTDRDDQAAGWFLALAALTGARTEELAAAPASLVRIGEVDCLDLREVGRKTSAAPRLAPILPDLLRMGLKEWAHNQAARGYTLVQPGDEARSAAAWSKRLNRYLNRHISDDPQLVLYSLRHSFRQMLRAANLGDELADKIFGHSTGRVGAGYGRELSSDEARLCIKAVRPPVDLHHLWPSC